MRKCVAAVLLLTGLAGVGRADPLVEPRVFASTNGVLDLLMIAKAQPVPTINFFPPSGGGPIHPTGWVYEVCANPNSGTNECPADSGTVADYGGVRLALQPGDTLKIRLVNRLPVLDPAKITHANDPGMGNLALNPTNLHTHGLVVPARAPTVSDPTFGDFVFVNIFNSANGMPRPQADHQHGSVKLDYADYRIDIPADHPNGLFWFHAHVHGLTVNQLASGLSGIITIGDVLASVQGASPNVRNMMIKDMQVLAAGTQTYNGQQVSVADGEVQTQEDGAFCEFFFKPPEVRQGLCGGAPPDQLGGNSYVGSKWYFTINGQVFPTATITSSDGEIWQLTNASPQVTYRLNLVDDTTHVPMPMQLIGIDGISVNVPAGTPAGTIMKIGGNRFTIVDCPAAGAALTMPVCVTDLIMMPSSRVQVWITYRDGQGKVVAPPVGATATLIQESPDLGPAAEVWPYLEMLKVQFAQTGSMRTALNVSGVRSARAAAVRPAMIRPATKPDAAPAQIGCRPLPAGHRRRIFFGMVDPTDPNSAFGLGYEEVDGNGVVLPGSMVPVTTFDPNTTTVCVPLGPGGAPVDEIWEIVNLATEAHNFHIHQARFSVLAGGGLNTPVSAPANPIVVEDSVPLTPAIANIAAIADDQNGYCTIEQWRNQQCSSTATVVDIPFTQLGDFMYHCHIAEHTDLGMMAKISVVTNALATASAHDFDGDGRSDILWRNSDGDASIWFMNGGRIAAGVGLGNVSPNFNIVGTADFDGDGHTDILWRNSAGDTSIWFMNGSQVLSTTSLGNVPAAWSVVGVGDFNGDGKADILWRNTGGDATIWFMNGAQIASGANLGNIPTVWSVAGVGDFNGDGKADILWRDTAGDAAIWFMNGAQIASGAGLGAIPTVWSVAGLRDFDGDGKADILWRNNSGDVAMWLMNGAQIVSGAGLGNIPTVWSLVHALDFSGDGMSDILWRNTSGDLSMWLMNGAQITSGTGLGNIPTSWTVQNVNAN